jgi:trans-aconitate 2-methyltransferase
MSSRSWDAGTYDRVSDVQDGWAGAVLDRLPLRGDETVLDAGCGSGRVTRRLLEKLPHGRVVALDASEEMVAHAREALPPERATVIHADLADFALDEPVDAIFSNAVFHWVLDHDALFGCLRRALKPGGRLVAQCGGAGNLDRFWGLAREVAAEPPFAEHLTGMRGASNFATAEETAERLRRAGFTDIHTWLQERPTELPPRDGRTFVASVCLIRHLDRIPAERRDAFVDELLARYGEPVVLDYVRLNMTATRR